MGAPGAGKGTQARLVAEKYGVPQISTGEIFRDHLRRDTEIGQQVRPFLASGQLAPDDLTCSIVDRRLTEADCRNGYILDGFPRSLEQAQRLQARCEQRGERLNCVINLAVPDDVIVERLTARRICPECGIIYSLIFSPPSDPRFCDHHENRVGLIQRDDDTEVTVRKRLDVHHQVTQPILDFYTGTKQLHTVEGDACSPSDVFTKIESILRAQGVPKPR